MSADVQMEAKEQPLMSSEGMLFRQGFSHLLVAYCARKAGQRATEYSCVLPSSRITNMPRYSLCFVGVPGTKHRASCLYDKCFTH